MKKKPKYPFWLQEIIDAGEAGFISSEDVQKCIEGLKEAKALESYSNSSVVLKATFVFCRHSYGCDFWYNIDEQLRLYRKKLATNEKEI